MTATTPIVRFTHEHADAKLPEYMTTGAAGMDLTSVEEKYFRPGERILVSTGLRVEIPPGYEGQVRPRSGLALRGITVLNSPGTIDSDYRGELKVLLYNASGAEYSVHVGDRIAQFVIAPVARVEPQWADELPPSARGAGGWGSTGVGAAPAGPQGCPECPVDQSDGPCGRCDAGP